MIKHTLFLLILSSLTNLTFGQNTGFGESTPTSRVHIKGSGNTSATSSLNVTNSGSNSLFFVRDDGKIGVGTTSPTENFHILGQNFAVTGVVGNGDALSLSGAGTRMFFYPQKSAFRVGTVTANQWNDGSIGNYSIAMGQNTTASGAASTALGIGTSATNSYATALGANTTASGIYSTAMGYNTVANGQNSTAIGTATTASGQYAIAIGNGVTASGIGTIALGQSTIASAYRETAIGSYNTIASGFSPSAWVATDRLFTIGNGTGAGAESNALVMLKNGNTTLKGSLTLTNGTSSFTLPKVDGTVGQGLVTDGNGNVSWGSPTTASSYTAGTGIAIASDVISNTGDLSDTNELELPAQTGNTGKYLTTDGTNVSWGALSGAGTSLNGAYNEGGAGAGRTITADSGAVLIQGEDGFQVTGTYGSGDTLSLAGAGVRMFFYPNKAAFRAGNVDNTEWDNANIGNNSTAMGYNTTAKGSNSTAMGINTIANGSGSIAMGTNTTASSSGSIAIGYNTTASAARATAMGFNTLASGSFSTAMGFNTIASSSGTTAMGSYTTASGSTSTAMGGRTTASGSASTAMGSYATASGNISTAMGYYTTASAFIETAIGSCNTPATSPSSINWIATDRLFTIGNGIDTSNKSDALVMLKNGNTTLKGALTLTDGTSSFTLPQTDGTAGQVLTTDGSGVVSWGTAASGGSSLNTAYNYGGAGAGRTITADNGAVLVNGTDGLQVTGTWGAGAILSLSGAGNRMFFYPRKAAFRAGTVSSTEWDEANIGYNSVAFGGNTKASGANSFATGFGINSTGIASFGTGYYATISGDYAFAAGTNLTASGNSAISMGANNVASGNNSTAMGSNTTASGDYSTATGYYTIADGENSTAIGYGATANGDYSIATGSNTTADGYISTAMGGNTAANGSISTAIGRNVVADAYSEIVIGACNTIATTPNATAWVATDRLFTIGNGASPSTRSNALVILKNGNATFSGNVAVNGTLCSTSGTVVACSDIRYKQNILPISAVSGSALAKLAAVNGYYYDFRVNEFPEKKFSDAKQIGFIAQELEKVYPELVMTDDKGYKSVDYAKITPVLVEAIKELKAENEALKAKNAHLEANDSEIKAKVEALENAVYGNAKR